MFCKECGKQIPEESKFCCHCGFKQPDLKTLNQPDNEPNKTLMLTINATAERVGLSSYRIRKWALNGTIKAIRVGNKIFINNDDLDNYLNGHTLNDNVEEQESIFKPIPIK